MLLLENLFWLYLVQKKKKVTWIRSDKSNFFQAFEHFSNVLYIVDAALDDRENPRKNRERIENNGKNGGKCSSIRFFFLHVF